MVSMRTVAVVLVVVGAAAFALPTVASEGFTTERPTTFSVASEDEALVDLDETGRTVKHPGKIQGRSSNVVIGELTHNFDSEPDFDVDTRSQALNLKTKSGKIKANCKGTKGTGEATVTVTVDSASADGVSVENLEYEFQVDYDCTPPSNGGNPGDGGAGDGGHGGDGNRGPPE